MTSPVGHFRRARGRPALLKFRVPGTQLALDARARVAFEGECEWGIGSNNERRSVRGLFMAEAVQRLLESDGDQKAIGNLDELRESVERMDAYQEFQPERSSAAK